MNTHRHGSTHMHINLSYKHLKAESFWNHFWYILWGVVTSNYIRKEGEWTSKGESKMECYMS